MGLTGTFEGYVPMATDLYLRGNNLYNWATTSTSSADGVHFETGQITIDDGNTKNLYSGRSANLAGFSRICLEGWIRNSNTFAQTLNLRITNSSGIGGDVLSSIRIDASQTAANPVFNFNLGATKYLNFEFLRRLSGVIYRIWLS